MSEGILLAEGASYRPGAVGVAAGESRMVVLWPAGRLKNSLMTLVPNTVSRLVTNTWHQGSFLITTLVKR